MANDSVFIGTELKFIVNLQSPGFDMDEDDYSFVVSCGKVEKTIAKQDVILDGEGNHIITIDTTDFKKGDVFITAIAEVPDDAFPDGKRTEIDKRKLITIKPL